MKRSLAFLILFFQFAFFAEGQVTFQKTYGGSLSAETGMNVHQTFDGGYIVVGQTDNFGAGDNDVHLIKTDSLGDTLWTRTFGQSFDDGGKFVEQTSDSGFIITGYGFTGPMLAWNIYLIKVDLSGNYMWSKCYGTDNAELGNVVHQTNDGGYIIAGTYLVKTNSIGDTLWTKAYGKSIVSASITYDGGYILACVGGGLPNIGLIKTDSVGNEIWNKSIGEYGFQCQTSVSSIKQTPDSGFVLIGTTFHPSFTMQESDIYLVKTNSNGDTIWTKSYGMNQNDLGKSIELSSDGGYIFTGTVRDSLNAPFSCLLKTDSGGNILWSKIITLMQGNWVEETSDRGFIISGVAVYTNTYETYLTKTDSIGNFGCESDIQIFTNLYPSYETTNQLDTYPTELIVGSPSTIIGNGCTIITLCSSVSIPELSSFQHSFTLSPNPTSTTFTVTTSQSQINSIEIFNVLGEKVMAAQSQLTNLAAVRQVQKSEMYVDVRGLSSGIYFVKVESEERSAVQKLVKQ